MFDRLAQGFTAPLKSFTYLTENKLWGYAILPLCLTAAIAVLVAIGIWIFVLSNLNSLLDFRVDDWPAILRGLFYLIRFVLKIVILYLLFSLIMRLFLALFGIVVIPFLSPLVEKILQKEGVAIVTIKNAEWIGYIFSSIVYSVKMLLWQTIVAILLIFTGPLQPALNLFFSSYYLGRSYFDYVLELLGHPAEFSKRIGGLKAEVTGLGLFSSASMFVPVIGPVFSPILSTVAAARIFVEKKITVS